MNNPASGRRKTLIAIFQRGGGDGLNMVVPHASALITHCSYARRSTAKGRNATPRLILTGSWFASVAWSAQTIVGCKRLAIVDAVGSPDNTRSHFDAQDYMESATPGVKSTRDGCLNRYLQNNPDSKATPFRAVSMTQNLPRTSRGVLRCSAFKSQRLYNSGWRKLRVCRVIRVHLR